MKIRPYHFHIENFRSFKDTSFELGRKLTVISGQNGVGKSNILSLIASGSGVSTKSMLGSNFQPEFSDFFNIDENELYEDYKLYLTYVENDGKEAFTKRLSFKDDTKFNRGMASRQAKACSIAFYSFYFLYSFCLFYSAVMMRYLSYIFMISYFIPIWNSDHKEILIS